MDAGWVEIVLSALGGGALASFLTFKIALKKQKLTEFEILIQEYKELHDDLRQRVTILEDQLHSLKIVEIKQREEILSLQELLLKKDSKLKNYEGKNNIS